MTQAFVSSRVVTPEGVRPAAVVVEQGRILERGNHAELFALGGRYYDLYTRQHGLEANLFLAPGEGDVVPGEGDVVET